jgi:archaellum component FlaC
MEPLNTILLGTISALLSVTLYVLSSLNDKIKDLKTDIGDKLDKIEKDIDTVWRNIRDNENKITVLETRCKSNHGEF